MQQLPAVETREHHVEDDQVVFLLLDKIAAVEAIERHIHGETRLAQALGEEIGGFGFIFYDQQTHGTPRLIRYTG